MEKEEASTITKTKNEKCVAVPYTLATPCSGSSRLKRKPLICKTKPEHASYAGSVSTMLLSRHRACVYEPYLGHAWCNQWKAATISQLQTNRITKSPAASPTKKILAPSFSVLIDRQQTAADKVVSNVIHLIPANV